MKYSGSGGKSGSSDANAELMAQIRKIFNENDVKWQSGELGKIDGGGGGTIDVYKRQPPSSSNTIQRIIEALFLVINSEALFLYLLDIFI